MGVHIPMYDKTVTVFNHVSGGRLGDMWYPTILHNCNVNLDLANAIAKYGEESQDVCVLNVRLPCEKPYLPPKEWQRAENKAESITFTPGDKDYDFFYIGDWQTEDVVADDDYEAGFYSFMNAHYDYVYAVNTVNGPFTVIPHLEVTGR
jgi:hypothetical protein